MWPLRRKKFKQISKAIITEKDGGVNIDVRGQSCPNFIISIQRALQSLEPGIVANLFLTYGPGNADIRILCAARKIKILGMEQNNGVWTITVKKPTRIDDQQEVEQIYRQFIEGNPPVNAKDAHNELQQHVA